MYAEQISPEDAEQIKQEEDLNALGTKLNRLAQDQVSARQQLETRWLQDLRQYHGEYTPDEVSRMNQNKSSRVFVNITRNKTRAAIARMSDMLLPNDDTNFGVKPTPVPATSALNGLPMQADMQQGAMVQGMEPGMPPGMGQQAPEDSAKEQADDAARAMQKQIEDDFAEANYNAHTRDVIQDACLLGTGILKGPTVVNRTRRAWITDPETGQSVMEVQQELRPGLERVDTWDFFPDMSASSMVEAEFTFERKLLNRKQMRELADLPGVLPNQLRRALQDDEGRHIAEDRRHQLREITGVDTVTNDKKYELWEYWGPLDKDELRACGCEDIDDDPLIEYTGCVLMVNGHVIKAAINPLETGDLPYSVFNWEEDGASIFGFGVPYLMRQPQKVVNAAWRMMMDNAGLSAGPQIVVNKRAVEPQDGDWALRANKIWHYTGDEPIDRAMMVFQINNNQGDLFAIFEAAQRLADTETNLPILLQGEGMSGGPGARTATGMQMLMNNSNIVLRSATKNFDDGVTTPLVRRFYDYHMLYTDRPEIKGDFDIVAKGTSVLIAREEQQEKLMMLSQVAANNPIFADLTNWSGLYREILRTLQVPVDSVTYSDEELEQRAMNQSEQGPPPEMQAKMAELNLREQELQLKAQQQQFEQEFKAAELQTRQERDRMEIALKEGITMAELEARVGMHSEKMEADLQKTIAKLQSDRETKAAQLADSQNERLARQRNMNMGFDSF